MSIEATQQLAARYGDAWAEHDLDAILAMHTDERCSTCMGSASLRQDRCGTRSNCRHVRPLARPALREEQGLRRRRTLRQRVSDERNFGGQAFRMRRRRRDRRVQRSDRAEGHLPRLGGHAAATRCGADSFAIATTAGLDLSLLDLQEGPGGCRTPQVAKEHVAACDDHNDPAGSAVFAHGNPPARSVP